MREAVFGEWVSTKERLPEESGDYLVVTRTKRPTVLSFSARYQAFNVCSDSSTKFEIKTLYWMPLPEMPTK